jgi:hypothetical protein
VSAAVDIILPLSNESRSGDDELRIFLRSLEVNGMGYGRIWLLTTCPPVWLRDGDELEVLGLTVVEVRDSYRHCKDANLFCKAWIGCEYAGTRDVIFTADDCAILKPCDLSALPPIFNDRTAAQFGEGTTWMRRMVATLADFPAMKGNFDTHCPQRWNAAAARKIIDAGVWKWRPPSGDAQFVGRCIDTFVMGNEWGGIIPDHAVRQQEMKETVAGRADAAHDVADGKSAKLDRVFVGYDDAAFLRGGLRERLFERFPERSRWER